MHYWSVLSIMFSEAHDNDHSVLQCCKDHRVPVECQGHCVDHKHPFASRSINNKNYPASYCDRFRVTITNCAKLGEPGKFKLVSYIYIYIYIYI